jgi:hypothetical protein
MNTQTQQQDDAHRGNGRVVPESPKEWTIRQLADLQQLLGSLACAESDVNADPALRRRLCEEWGAQLANVRVVVRNLAPEHLRMEAVH